MRSGPRGRRGCTALGPPRSSPSSPTVYTADAVKMGVGIPRDNLESAFRVGRDIESQQLQNPKNNSIPDITIRISLSRVQAIAIATDTYECEYTCTQSRMPRTNIGRARDSLHSPVSNVRELPVCRPGMPPPGSSCESSFRLPRDLSNTKSIQQRQTAQRGQLTTHASPGTEHTQVAGNQSPLTPTAHQQIH
jgi:hypothetical protein